MMINPLIVLILLSIGLLISSFIIGIIGIIRDLKKNPYQYIIFIILIGITMILLLPVIIGVILDLNL